VVAGEGAHLVDHEAGAGAALSGVQFSIAGAGGLFTPADIDAVVQPAADWARRTRLVTVENTHNRAGGRAWPVPQARDVAEHARALGLATHLDGARIWNASIVSGVEVSALSRPFDTVSVCFSKGLGAPAGSAFCGPRAMVQEARRLRRRWGGAMRQSGVLAAAALYAIHHNRPRLADDHANAHRLAQALQDARGVRIDLPSVQTNLVNIDVDASSEAVVREARQLGVLVLASAPRRIRAVTHLDVSREDIERAATALAQAVIRAMTG
jgi:threonine aldolase